MEAQTGQTVQTQDIEVNQISNVSQSYASNADITHDSTGGITGNPTGDNIAPTDAPTTTPTEAPTTTPTITPTTAPNVENNSGGLSVLTIDEINKLKKAREEKLAASQLENKTSVRGAVSNIVLSALSVINKNITAGLISIQEGIKKAIAEGKTEYTYKIAEFKTADMYLANANNKYAGYIWSTYIDHKEVGAILLEYIIELIGERGRELFGYIRIEEVRCERNNLLQCYELAHGHLFRRVVDLPLLLYYSNYLSILEKAVEKIESPRVFHFVDGALLVTFKL